MVYHALSYCHSFKTFWNIFQSLNKPSILVCPLAIMITLMKCVT